MSADGDSSELNYCEDEHGQRFIPGLPIRWDNEDYNNQDDDIAGDPSYDEYMSRILAVAVETLSLRLSVSVIGSDETGQAAPIKQRCPSRGKNLTHVRNYAIHRATDSKGPIKQRRPSRGKNLTHTQKNTLHRLFFQGMCNHKKEAEELRRQAVAETNLTCKQIDVCLLPYSVFHSVQVLIFYIKNAIRNLGRKYASKVKDIEQIVKHQTNREAVLSGLCRIHTEALNLDRNRLANQLRLGLIGEKRQLSKDIVCNGLSMCPRQGLTVLSASI